MLLICGDALIDFIPSAGAAALPDYRPTPGGSACTVALGLARLGASVGFMGGLSTDFFGQFLAATMEQAGVSLHHAGLLHESSTLAFVKPAQEPGQEPHYAFYNRETALRCWRRAASPPLGEAVRLLHTGSAALIAEPAAREYLALFRAEKGRRLLSIDPNCRPGLIEDPAGYHDRLREMLALADIIKLSIGDLDYLLPGVTPDSAARHWIERGARLVVVSQGAEGACGYTRDGRLRIPARRVSVADTAGAGDSLLAALLWRLDEAGALTLSGLDALGLPALEAALAVAVGAAAITCGRAGADLPWRHEVSSLVAE